MADDRDLNDGGGAEAWEPSAPQRPPEDRIDGYRLARLIGEGGFGEVWMAEQYAPVRRRVALKIIKLGMDTRQVIARFEAERQALAVMDHPNIARMLDAGSTESGRPYFVMELVRGVPLVEYCDANRLSARARLELFIAVCQGIQHAHLKGIIHRDVKPSNVLVAMHDGAPVAKVIDFGIAKAIGAGPTERTLVTQQRQMIGTPAYMSPEQADMSASDVDTRSDIYSLGVLLYELLTGTTPLPEERLRSMSLPGMMLAIQEEHTQKPSSRLAELGGAAAETARRRRLADPGKLRTMLRGELDWIVMKCLEKDRARRYETASALAGDVRRYLDHQPVTAGPPSASYQLRKYVQRHRGRVIAGGVAAAAVLLGLVGTAAGLAVALEQKARAVAAEQNARRELARATEVKRLMTQMLASVTPEEARGADARLLKRILDDTAERLQRGDVNDPLIASELHSVVGKVYMKLGLYESAEQHQRAALETRERELGEEDPDTLRLMSELGATYEREGRYVEAQLVLSRALGLSKRVLGPEHPNTLGVTSSLAGILEALGRADEAEAMYREALEAESRTLGEEHPATLATMNNLASLYGSLGRFAEAEPLYVKVLKVQEAKLGAEHPITLTLKNNLASVYADLGRLDEAEAILSQTVEVKTRILGPEHPDTLTSVHNMGLLLQRQGRLAEAEAMLEKNLQVRRRVLGEEHPATQESVEALAGVRAAEVSQRATLPRDPSEQAPPPAGKR